MHYNPLSQLDRIEKTTFMTNRIIVNALQSERGDSIRAMDDEDFKNMLATVFCAVHNILAEEARCAANFEFTYGKGKGHLIFGTTVVFMPRYDVVIEEEVSDFFETKGKLRYRKVISEPFIVFPGIDESLEQVTQQMEMGVRGMQYDPYSLEDRLERADILTNSVIMNTLQRKDGVDIRAMSYAEFKRARKDVFTEYYHALVAEAADNFEQACKDYVPERDGIENDPRTKFKPKTEFEIDQELNAYFEEQGMLN